jgi:hypothetical protein
VVELDDLRESYEYVQCGATEAGRAPTENRSVAFGSGTKEVQKLGWSKKSLRVCAANRGIGLGFESKSPKSPISGDADWVQSGGRQIENLRYSRSGNLRYVLYSRPLAFLFGFIRFYSVVERKFPAPGFSIQFYSVSFRFREIEHPPTPVCSILFSFVHFFDIITAVISLPRRERWTFARPVARSALKS